MGTTAIERGTEAHRIAEQHLQTQQKALRVRQAAAALGSDPLSTAQEISTMRQLAQLEDSSLSFLFDALVKSQDQWDREALYDANLLSSKSRAERVRDVICFIGRFERFSGTTHDTVRAHYRHPDGGVRMTEWCGSEDEARQQIPMSCRVDGQNVWVVQV